MTGERITLGETAIPCAQTHLARYVFALKWIDEKTVIDAGCGEGYGSWLMAHAATHVCGVDVCAATILDTASQKYKRPNLRFRVGNWLAENDIYEPAEVIVAFESLEHMGIDGQPVIELAMNRVWERLAPGGVFIGSLPIMQGENKWHVAGEMTFGECVDTIGYYFTDVSVFHQPFESGSERVSNVCIRTMEWGNWEEIESGQVIVVCKKPEIGRAHV